MKTDELFKPLVVAIVGPSGAGKDTAAQILCETFHWHRLVSYTTRPMRDGEADGVQHYFVGSYDEAGMQPLAHCVYGDYHYWAQFSQVSGRRVVVYVVDETGLRQLSVADGIRVAAIYLDRDKDRRLASGVSRERMLRDEDRKPLSPLFYDYVVENNGTLKLLRSKLFYVGEKIARQYNV